MAAALVVDAAIVVAEVVVMAGVLVVEVVCAASVVNVVTAVVVVSVLVSAVEVVGAVVLVSAAEVVGGLIVVTAEFVEALELAAADDSAVVTLTALVVTPEVVLKSLVPPFDEVDKVVAVIAASVVGDGISVVAVDEVPA